MSKRMTRRDPIERVIELALSPGAYIRDRACISFVSRLEGVAAQIDQLQKADPARAAGRYGGNPAWVDGQRPLRLLLSDRERRCQSTE